MGKRVFQDILDTEYDGLKFFMLPQVIITDDYYKGLSNDAKILYMLFFNRDKLSHKNAEKFKDEDGRIYIIYSREEICQDLNVCNKTAGRVLKELEEFGLIERKRKGLGKANWIYLKSYLRYDEKKTSEDDNDENCSVDVTEQNNEHINENASDNQDVIVKKETVTPEKSTDVSFFTIQDMPKSTIQEMSNSTIQNGKKVHIWNGQKVHTNNIYNNNTYESNTYYNHNAHARDVVADDYTDIFLLDNNNPDYQNLILKPIKGIDLADDVDLMFMDDIVSAVKLIADNKDSEEQITIKGVVVTIKDIYQALRQLTSNHYRFMLARCKELPKKPQNITKYIIATLYSVITDNTNQLDIVKPQGNVHKSKFHFSSNSYTNESLSNLESILINS